MDIVDRFFYALLVFIPLSVVAWIFAFPALVVFICASLAVVPLAKFLGDATEEIAAHVGVALGGLLNAAFGNAPELIIALFALNAGLIDVVKASLIGSILSNLLLVLGMATFAGGLKHKHQKFNATAAKASGSTLFLAVSALIIPALFISTTSVTSPATVEVLSIVVACLLILAYAGNLFFSLSTHQHLYIREAAAYIPRWSKRKSYVVLLLAALGIALVSRVLVDSIEPVVMQFGWTDTFIGIIILAIIGNVAEHVSAVRIAQKDNMDLSLQISIGSATQIALFVAPVLVLVSLFFAHQMNLVFSVFELAALILAVLVANTVVEDGESNWFEGLLLLIAYAIIATAFFLHP